MLNDLRYAIRTLIKDRGFSAVAILTLALGIGANSALFSVVNGVILKPLPFPDPDRIVRLYDSNPRLDVPFFSVSPPNYLDWRTQTHVFQTVAAYERQQDVSAAADGEIVPAMTARVSANLFDLLQVPPASGRTFGSSEEDSNEAIISDGLWHRLFRARPDIAGQPLIVDGALVTVVGVMPPAFALPGNDADIWMPAGTRWTQAPRDAHSLRVLARLRASVSEAQMRADLDSVAVHLEREFPDTNAGWRVNSRHLSEVVVAADTRQALWVLLGAVAFVLLIACANLASLLIARGLSRRREFAVRLALGASRWRVVRQLVAESVLLAIAGGIAGLLLAVWAVDLLQNANPDAIPRLSAVRVDGTVLAFTITVSLIAGVMVGLLPSLQGTRMGLVASLRDGGRGQTAGAGRQRTRSLLVMAEVGLSLVLLLGAGLLIKSFWRLQNENPGFVANSVTTTRVSLPDSRYPTDVQVANYFDRLLVSVASLADARAVAVANLAPLSAGNTANTFRIVGRAPRTAGEKDAADFRVVSASYFETLRIPVLRGRTLSDRDRSGAQPVAVIDAAMARQYWPGGDPIGQQILFSDGVPRNIVGVVGQVANGGLDRVPRPTIYFPFQQLPRYARGMTIVVRSGNPERLAGALPAQVRSLDADLIPMAIRSLEEIVDETFSPRRFNLALLLAFAGVAVLLSAIGIYGVTAYAVGQRTHELGIRLALGAAPGDLVKLIVGQGSALVSVGLVGGLAGGLALTRLLSALLFDLSPTDPGTFVAVSTAMGVLCLAACYLPARRVMRIDPLLALRNE